MGLVRLHEPAWSAAICDSSGRHWEQTGKGRRASSAPLESNPRRVRVLNCACAWRTGGLRVLGACGENVALLRQSVLRHGLLPLQLLDAVLQLDDFCFVYFEWRLHRRRRRKDTSRGGRLLPSREPHDGHHEDGKARKKPGLDVPWKQSRRFWCLVLNGSRRSHGCSLTSAQRGA